MHDLHIKVYDTYYIQNVLEAMNTTVLTGLELMGLELSFSDQANKRYSHFILDSSIRSYDFNSAMIHEKLFHDEFGQVTITVTLVVVTEAGRFYSNSTMVEGN